MGIGKGIGTSGVYHCVWKAAHDLIRGQIHRFHCECRKPGRGKRAAAEHRKPELMETFCPHSMRHTFATRALEKGIPPKVVQSYLGHSTIDVTMNIYTHVTAELEREEIRKIANQF